MFLDYEKRRIRLRLILPAHRIRICLQDQFGFRPPPSRDRAQARGGIFRPSYELCCIALLCSNLFRTGNGLIARLVRSLRSREQKPKIFLTFLIFLGGGCGGSRQKMERKFLVLLRRYKLRNEHLYYITCGSLALFISPSLRRDEALPFGV